MQSKSVRFTGDTLTTCQGNKIRLAGIDAPEIKQRYGSQARNTLNNLVIGQNIALQCEGKSYDRKVCTVFLGTRNINQVMVQQGFAYDYQQYSHGAYLPAQQYAQTHHLGVWQQESGGQRPWDYRRHLSKKRNNRTFKF